MEYQPYPYECEPCEVRGYGTECWLCGGTPERIGRLVLPMCESEVADVFERPDPLHTLPLLVEESTFTQNDAGSNELT